MNEYATMIMTMTKIRKFETDSKFVDGAKRI